MTAVPWTPGKCRRCRCPWCRQLVDVDTIPPWWLDHRNLAELYAHMSGSDCPEDDALDPASVQYFLEKPWKWADEYARMRAEKARTEKSRTEKERTK